MRTYGTRTCELLAGVQGLNDLGRHFGANLYQREVEFLAATEWARSAEDILWRRTKLGLNLSPAEVESLQSYLRSRSSSDGLCRVL